MVGPTRKHMAQRDRRFEVSEAAWRVIVREGLDRTSMRAIAQEMNCTTGVVTHYFRNKQALIMFALHQVTERLQIKMAEAIAPLTDISQVNELDQFVAMLLSFLPFDQERQDILQVWVAFLGYAVGRAELMAEHQKSAAQLRNVIIQALTTLQQQGRIRPDVEPAMEANTVLALVNGVSLDSLLQAERLSSGQQEIIIRRYVNSLC